MPPIPLISGRELFVDHHLIESLDGAQLVLHRPQPQEIVLKFDEPSEGLYSGYETVLKDNETYRFDYRGMPEAKHDLDTEEDMRTIIVKSFELARMRGFLNSSDTPRCLGVSRRD